MRRFARSLLLAALVLLVLPAAPAFAGRLWVTGHDADLHCSGGQQCHYVRVAVDHVRGGAPDPSKPVLVLDRDPSGGTSLDFVTALDNAFGAGNPPRVVMDPRSSAFASEPLTTDRYSAILIASDVTCGGCDLNTPTATPDSDAINARSNDIAAFFNAGGGVYANSGGSHGDGDPSTGPDTYYQFIPLPLGGKPVQPPFCLTPRGATLGLQDQSCPDPSRHTGTNDDINCCATHNSFTNPAAGSALEIAEIDLGGDGVISGDDSPETLVAQGTISGGQIVSATTPVLGKTVNAQVVSGRVFASMPSRSARASARVPGLRGRKFVRLAGVTTIPVRSILDTRRGKVRLTTATTKAGKTQAGLFSAGVFQVLQSRRKRFKGLAEMRLKGFSFKRCRSSSKPASSSRRRRRIRRLRARARGRFRTRGRRSAATVRGTTWTIADRCDGTLTSVKRGRVAVRDFRRHKTIILRAGKSYLAR